MSAGRRCVAFLRAINVGGHVVKMDRLRGLFEALKLRNVETMIASGNVLFDAPRSATAEALDSRKRSECPPRCATSRRSVSWG
jgi:uncharacterized protein (DUF1697 family)